MIVDLLISIFCLVAIITGYKNGFIPSILALVGYLAGGLAGLYIAKELSSDWQGVPKTIGLFLIAIFLGAKIGEKLLRGIGKGFRSLIGPLKLFDGLLGAVLGALKAIVFVYFFYSVLLLTPWERLTDEISKSQMWNELSTRAPGALAEVFEEVKSRLDS